MPSFARAIVSPSAGTSRLLLALSAALLFLVGWLDVATGPEIALSAFYLPAIALAAWVGTTGGIVMSFLASAIWIWADITSGQQYSHYLIHYWNGAIRLAMFLAVSFLLSAFKDAVESERWAVAREQRRMVVVLMEQMYEPLRAIMGNTDLLTSEKLPPESKICVAEIRQSADRLHRVLLRLREIEEGETPAQDGGQNSAGAGRRQAGAAPGTAPDA